MLRVIMNEAGEVARVLLDGAPLAEFEVEIPTTEAVAACKYCGASITADDRYWSVGADAADWYDDHDLYCFGTSRAHRPADEITHEPHTPHVRVVTAGS
ncbi:hypothetical protein BJF78_30095 [Pseudonocardia sp. CNS-139]|nr:hypothetical protein BJF78_30095 [Pseudonocardia sp. CNS-139]